MPPQPPPPATPLPRLPHALAIDEFGKVQGWGTNRFGEAVAPLIEEKFIAVAAGLNYSLALDASYKLHHWGNPATAVVTRPGDIFSSIGAGARQAIAVRFEQSPAHGYDS